MPFERPIPYGPGDEDAFYVVTAPTAPHQVIFRNRAKAEEYAAKFRKPRIKRYVPDTEDE